MPDFQYAKVPRKSGISFLKSVVNKLKDDNFDMGMASFRDVILNYLIIVIFFYSYKETEKSAPLFFKMGFQKVYILFCRNFKVTNNTFHDIYFHPQVFNKH